MKHDILSGISQVPNLSALVSLVPVKIFLTVLPLSPPDPDLAALKQT
jgi:hypothetical protein